MSTLYEAKVTARLEKPPGWSPVNGQVPKTFQQIEGALASGA